MKSIQLTGKAINQFAANTSEMPDYYGQRVWMPSPDYKSVKTNGEMIAKRYKDICRTIEEVKGTVYVQPHSIHVTYKDGNFTIKRDILVDTFLIPLLKTA